MIRFFLAALFGVCCLLPAAADDMTLLGVGNGKKKSSAPAAYVGPGDVVSGASAWYGLRCYTKAYSGNVVDLTDSSTGTTTGTRLQCSNGVVSALVSGSACTFVTGNACSSLATTCATACNIEELYDQSGNTLHFVQATNAKRPTYTPNCLNTTLPCITFGVTTMGFPNVAVSWVTQPLSLSVVANRVSSPAGSDVFTSITSSTSTGCEIGPESPPGDFFVFTSTTGTYIQATATANAWHAANGSCAGGSSVLNVDGTDTAHSLAASITGVNVTIGANAAGNTATGKITEVGWWNNLAFTSGQRTSLCHNQFAYWATATSC